MLNMIVRNNDKMIAKSCII